MKIKLADGLEDMDKFVEVEIPEGYYIVTKGKAKSSDLVWNAYTREWEECDDILDDIADGTEESFDISCYYAVLRKSINLPKFKWFNVYNYTNKFKGCEFEYGDFKFDIYVFMYANADPFITINKVDNKDWSTNLCNEEHKNWSMRTFQDYARRFVKKYIIDNKL